LDESYIGKVVARCVNEDHKDIFLAMNLIRDAETTILAGFEYLPTLSAAEAEAKEYRE